MKEGRPSLTAIAVACARGIAGVDPVAERLVPLPAAVGVRLVNRMVGDGALRGRAVRALSLGFVEHLELRTKAIDAVVAREATRGTRQVVVLGAGLDARAVRLDALEGSTVYEVDHPATQSLKRARVEGADHVRFVGVDFERDALDAKLAEAGHDPEAPTTWIWEGVTMYLAPDAIAATLAILRGRSAAGSVLALTYGTPEMSTYLGPIRRFVKPVFVALGEPLRGLVTTAEITRMVEAHGFAVEDDVRISELAPRYDRPTPRFLIAERLMVVRCRGTSRSDGTAEDR